MYDLALQQIKNFIDAYPATSQGIEARFYYGLTQFKLKRYEDARFTFQNFALSYGDHPKAPEAWLKVGESFIALHNDIEAAAAYERIRTFFPKSPLVPDALLNSALLYYRTGETERAKKMLKTILEDYPRTTNVYAARLAIARIYLEEGQADLAEQEMQHIAESEAPIAIKSNASFLLAKLQYDECLFDMAEVTLRANIQKYPKTEGAIQSALILGNILARDLKYNEALAQFQNIISSDAVDSLRVSALIESGKAASAARNFSGAVKYYQQVIDSYKVPPKIIDALLLAGQASLKNEHYADAIDYFRRAYSFPSTGWQAEALVRMAESAALLKQYQQASGYYSDFLAQFSNDPACPQVMLSLGTLYMDKMHDHPKAITIFSEIVEKYPRSPLTPSALLNMAACQESLANYQDAVQSYGTLLRDYPAYSQTEDIQHHIDFLKAHNVVGRDDGLQKLSRFVGEILLDKPKPQLSLKLADIYFHDLKDYRSAAEQYTNAIDKGLNENEFINAYYYRARAMHYLSETDSSAAEQAITYYEAFIKQFPTNTLSNDAAFYSIQLKSRSEHSSESIARMKDLLSIHLDPQLRERLLYSLVLDNISSPDSTAGNDYLNLLTTEFPTSSLTQKALMLTGNQLVEHGHADSAILIWRSAIAKNPNGYFSASILNRLSDIQMSVKDYIGAEETLRKLAAQFPYTDEGTKAKEDRPRILLLAGKYSESIKTLQEMRAMHETLLHRDQDTSGPLFQLALAYDKLQKKDKAILFYRAFLHSNSMDAHASQAFYALGVFAKSDGNTNSATSYFKQAASHGGTTGATVEIAELLFENEQYSDAAKQYNQLSQSTSDPNLKKGYLRRAAIATLRDDKLGEGQRLISQYRTNFPNDNDADAEFLYETGMYHFRQQNFKAANDFFDKVAGDYKDSKFGAWGFYYIGKILEVTNSLENAAKHYNDVLQRFPLSDVIPHVLLSLGNMHFNAERYDQAIKYYQTIIDKPDLAKDVLPFAMNNLIQAYESTKLYDAALKIAKDYVSKFPTDENIVDKKIKIGLLYTKLGYFDQAVVHFQNLINESGSLLEAELRYNIGEAFYSKGEYEQAILEFLKVPYLVSRQGKINWTATSLYMAGQSYEKMSKFNLAIEMYQQVIDRTGIDATFKAAAKKEIERVKTITKQ